jgi:copper(I)-binding protein
MKVKRIRTATVLAMGAVCLAAAGANALGARMGDLMITQPWIWATPNGAPTTAADLTIINRGATSHRLLAGGAIGARRHRGEGAT